MLDLPSTFPFKALKGWLVGLTWRSFETWRQVGGGRARGGGVEGVAIGFGGALGVGMKWGGLG